MHNAITRQFESKEIRSVWVPEEEEWYFSVVDVAGALSESTNPRNYWNMLKARLNEEENETYTNCVQLKMRAADGKMRKTDAATTEQLLRIIQSIPSKKAEPFKLWLAQVGAERIEETIDPEKAIDRALITYLRKGLCSSLAGTLPASSTGAVFCRRAGSPCTGGDVWFGQVPVMGPSVWNAAN